MLSARNVHKTFGTLEVLKGIDIDVEKGEVVSIVGASGAGKSTLLHVLGTIEKADRAEITIDGQEVFNLKDKSLSAFRNKHIGFVFQFHHLLPEFTALENICIPAYIAKTERSKAQERARDLLDILSLTDRAEHKPSELSGGEQQRVAIARALVNKPSIVFADEPSGNLDSKASTFLHKLFFQLREELGQTFVIVTHNKELADMADRKMIIRDGLLFPENNKQE
jgi:lipoprotein-releasing system ATP-binding protein